MLSFRSNPKLLGSFLDGWLEDRVAMTNRTATLKAYRSQVNNHIKLHIGNYHVSKLHPNDLHMLYVKMAAAGKAPETINQTHAVLHRALGHAVDLGLLESNPADKTTPPYQAEHQPNPLTPGEAASVLKVTAGTWYCNLWTTLAGTGLRFSEAAGLQWPAVSAERLEVRHQLVRRTGANWTLDEPKAKRSRRAIPLPQSVQKALNGQKQALSGSSNPHELVFPAKSGQPMWEPTALRAFRTALKRAGAARHTIHDLRDTYATTLSANGVDPVAIQELLGHSSLRTTRERYIGRVESHLTTAVATLD